MECPTLPRLEQLRRDPPFEHRFQGAWTSLLRSHDFLFNFVTTDRLVRDGSVCRLLFALYAVVLLDTEALDLCFAHKIM
jgi:hypothetical protein